MLKKSDILKKKTYKTGDIAKILGISIQTVIKYCNSGDIVYSRNQYGHRHISNHDFCNYLDQCGLLYDDTINSKHDIIYGRVSTYKQSRRGDLDKQIEQIKSYAIEHNVQNLLIKKDIASGLNDNRKQFSQVLNLVMQGKVNRIFIMYKDRLTRFGFNYIKQLCDFHEVDIIIVSDEENNKSQAEELAEDIIALIHSFSGKLYGLRRKIKDSIGDDT